VSPFFAAFMGLVVGLLVGSYLTGRHKSGELDQAINTSDGRWRVSMSKLVGHLLNLGYETRMDGDVFEVDAPEDHLLISMPLRRFDPTALMDALADLPPAREWVDHREGGDPEYPESAPTDPPRDETPAPTETSTAAPPAPPAATPA
jgi:hypothetical protein